jgi:hypothetical protein
MFFYKTPGMQMIWPYDDRGSLIGKMYGSSNRLQLNSSKWDPSDVLTTEESRKLLSPLIKPLPSFDEMALDRQGDLAA